MATRARELAIRTALGASPLAIIRAVTGRVISATAVGLLIGVALSTAAARGIAGWLFGTAPMDPLTFVVVPGVVLVAVVAAVAPSLRKTMRMDAPPVLRQD